MPDITLVLHNIRSTHNVGSIFRTAEGFGVKDIVISGYTPYPLTQNDNRLPHESLKVNSRIHKTALGAEEMVPFTHFDNLDEWMKHNDSLASPLPLIALEQSKKSINIRHFSAPSRFALLLGEEVNGIDNKYLEHCNAILEIPMYGKKESFNVSVAAGVALFALNDI